MAFNRREIFFAVSGLVDGFIARMRSISASAEGCPDRSHLDLDLPRFAATSGEWTLAKTSGCLMRHFAEQDLPQNLANFWAGHLGANVGGGDGGR